MISDPASIQDVYLPSPSQEQKTFPGDKEARTDRERTQEIWRATVESPQKRLKDRYPLMRQVPYSFSIVTTFDHRQSLEKSINGVKEIKGNALSINLNSNGMLMIIDEKVEVSQVLKIGVPTPYTDIHVPTLAEVRWCKNIPFPDQSSVRFVGVKFLL